MFPAERGLQQPRRRRSWRVHAIEGEIQRVPNATDETRCCSTRPIARVPAEHHQAYRGVPLPMPARDAPGRNVRQAVPISAPFSSTAHCQP